MIQKKVWCLLSVFILLSVGMTATGCTDSSIPAETVGTAVHENHKDEENTLVLPELSAAALDGTSLKVVATTSIIGDVVAQVGGDAIELTTLMGAGQDPHSYEPAARELTAVADADVIFVNGWDLEEALVDNIAEIGSGVPVVAISADIEPLRFDTNEHTHEDKGQATDEPAHSGANPHVWFSVPNAMQWTKNVAQVLSELDPAHAETYASNAAAYQGELAELEAYTEGQLGQIPEDRRFLVTNHDAFGYFADSYGFTVIGTVIPGMSTLAEPSANDLASLIEEMGQHGLCTIFTETTVSDTLAQTVAGELNNCEDVNVVKLYTGSIGPVGSGADSYIGMFRTNVAAIVEGLR